MLKERRHLKNAKDPALSLSISRSPWLAAGDSTGEEVASLRPPFSTPLRSLGEPDPETPFLIPIEHAPPLFVRIREDKFSLKIPPPPPPLKFPVIFFILAVAMDH